MGLNITHTSNFQFENRERLMNAARELLARQGNSEEASQKLIDRAIFQAKSETNYAPQLAIIKASSQISLNANLKETLKYLKSNAVKKVTKEPVFGELWSLFSKEEVSYDGELADFILDESLVNIFAA